VFPQINCGMTEKAKTVLQYISSPCPVWPESLLHFKTMQIQNHLRNKNWINLQSKSKPNADEEISQEIYSDNTPNNIRICCY
jgi:hypothetical protein